MDVADLALDVLSHRLVLTYEALADEVPGTRIVQDVLDAVEPPQIAPSQHWSRRGSGEGSGSGAAPGEGVA